MAAPLLGRRPKRRAAKPRHCLTPGCGVPIACWQWLCNACFHQLPFARKQEICRAREQRAPHRIFGLSRDAAEWLAAQRLKRVGE